MTYHTLEQIHKLTEIYKLLHLNALAKVSNELQTVITPYSLCVELVDKIEKHLTKSTTVLTLNIEFVPILVSIFNQKSIPLSNLIYTTVDPNKKRFVEKKYGIVVIYYNNYYEMLKGIVMNRKFDIIVGNPPYNTAKQENSTRTGQLYAEFVEVALQRATWVAMIIPSLWTDKKHSIKDRLTAGLVECFETSKYFDINVPTCAIIYQKEYKGLCRIVTSAGNVIEKNISDGVIPMHGSVENVSFRTKIKRKQNLGDLWKRTNINRNDERIGKGTTKMVETMGVAGQPLKHVIIDAPHHEFKHFNKWKVCANNVGEWESLGGNLKIVEPNIGTSYSIVALGVESEQQATNLLAYLNTRFVRAIVKMVKNNTPNSKTVFSEIPLVDLSRLWTEEQLHEYFGLSIEEINLINQTQC